MRFGAVIALVLASGSLAWSAVIKSSFESGEFTDWTVQGEGWSVYGRAGSDGEKSAQCSVSKGEGPAMKACMRSIGKVMDGAVIKSRIDVYGKSKTKSSQVKIALMCVDAQGGILREVKKELTVPSSKFKRITLPEVIVPSGTVETYFMIVVEVPAAAKGNEWWRFDNIYINVQ